MDASAQYSSAKNGKTSDFCDLASGSLSFCYIFSFLAPNFVILRFSGNFEFESGTLAH